MERDYEDMLAELKAHEYRNQGLSREAAAEMATRDLEDTLSFDEDE